MEGMLTGTNAGKFHFKFLTQAHRDFNKDMTNESTSLARSNVRLLGMDTQKVNPCLHGVANRRITTEHRDMSCLTQQIFELYVAEYTLH